MNIKQTIIIAVLAFAAVFLAGCTTGGNTIEVDGASELTFDPDQAEVWAGVSILKQTANEAQNEANKAINDIIAGLKYAGISEKDISTEQLYLGEEREWKNGESKVVGWRASQTLKVKTTDLTKVGTIVDVAVKNGANQINNINFGLSDAKNQEYKQRALADAAANAKEKAETIASSLGVKLGKIKTVTESNYNYRPYTYAMKASAGAAEDMAAEAAQVLPSDVSVSGTIHVVYYVK